MNQEHRIFVRALPPVDENCPYLDDKTFIIEHFILHNYSDYEIDLLLGLGYRHFGSYFFRPLCGECGCCIPIRIPVNDFSPSRSESRVLNRNKDLEIKDNKGADDFHFRIYKNHKLRFKGDETEDYDQFCESFFFENSNSKALDYFINDELVCCSHYDTGRNSISAMYTYYNQHYGKRSLGKYAVLKLVELAVKLGKKYLYLGYYIEKNSHMNYKINYYPNQIAVNPNNWIDYIDKNNKKLIRSELKFLIETQ